MSFALILGSLIYGSMNKVEFREDNVFSYSSFTNPGSPFIKQMLVHRSMMSFFSYCCMLYSMLNLPENVAIALLMLQPFFVGLAAYTYQLEKIGPI